MAYLYVLAYNKISVLFVPCCAVGAQCRLPHTTLHTADMGGKVYGWSGGDAGEKKIFKHQNLYICFFLRLLQSRCFVANCKYRH